MIEGSLQLARRARHIFPMIVRRIQSHPGVREANDAARNDGVVSRLRDQFVNGCRSVATPGVARILTDLLQGLDKAGVRHESHEIP